MNHNDAEDILKALKKDGEDYEGNLYDRSQEGVIKASKHLVSEKLRIIRTLGSAKKIMGAQEGETTADCASRIVDTLSKQENHISELQKRVQSLEGN